jgi:hypothetical protein
VTLAIVMAAFVAALIGWGMWNDRREWAARLTIWAVFAAEKQMTGSGSFFEGQLGPCHVYLKLKELRGTARSPGMWYGEIVLVRAEKLDGWLSAFAEDHPPVSFHFSHDTRVAVGLEGIETYAEFPEAAELLRDEDVRRALQQGAAQRLYLEARDCNAWVLWPLFSDDRRSLEAAWRLAEAIAGARDGPYR